MTPDDAIPKALDGIRDLYAGNLAAHGATSKSVGWRDGGEHLLRFDRLARVIDPSKGDTYTANDWGCGYGAMFGYLDARPGPRLAAYTGYDISQEMIEAATAACDPARSRFVLGPEVTGDADYSFISGTFNVKFDTTDEAWAAYVQGHLERIWAHSRRGLAFNLLTSYVDWKAENLYYADPCAYFDFCKRRLSRFVTLVHDSALYEWTILVSRDPQP